MSKHTSDEQELAITQEDSYWIFSNIGTLTKCIASPDHINAALLEKGLFTKKMYLQVEGLLAANEKVQKIMGFIVMRGKYAFKILCQVLKDTNNLDAVAFLEPVAAGYLDEDSFTNEIEVIHCNQSSAVYKEHWNNPMTYNMKQQKRGRAIIINNKRFGEKEIHAKMVDRDRYGTDVDRNRLKVLFEQLFFEVVVYEDQTGQDILNVLEKERNDQYHKSADCFILIILTHGTNGAIFGIDDVIVPEDIITGYFTTRSCPNLAGKPKLFFIQACKGDKSDFEDTALTEKDSSYILTSRKKDIGLIQHDETPELRIDYQDILVAFPTYPGHKSLRHRVYGSYFVQALILVFQDHSHKEDVLNLLTLVHGLMSKTVSARYPEKKLFMRQTPNFKSCLNKKLYFFPGCHE